MEHADSRRKGDAATFPKEWLVTSYFSGYDLLSAAFGMKSTDSTFGLPPEWLAGDEDELDGLEPKEGDFDAYELLCRLVRLLEDVAVGEAATGNFNKDLDQEAIVAPSEGPADFKVLLHLDVVESGQCLIMSNDYSDSCNAEAAVPCANYMAALALLLEEGAHGLTGAILKDNGWLESIQVDNSDTESLRSVSSPLRARLLNATSSIVFLAGDSIGAEKCLRMSVALDASCEDSRVKLAAVLSDMTEEDEV